MRLLLLALFAITISCSKDNTGGEACTYAEIRENNFSHGDPTLDQWMRIWYCGLDSARCIAAQWNQNGSRVVFGTRFQSMQIVNKELRVYLIPYEEAINKPDSHYNIIGANASFDCHGIYLTQWGNDWHLKPE